MILVPIIFMVIGAVIALAFRVRVDGIAAQYLAVACVAGFDTVLGGLRSAHENKFQTDVFLTGFFTNTIIAFAIAWLGDQIGINLYLVVTLVMGMRIFNNLSIIRRYVLQNYIDMMSRIKRKKLEEASQKENSQSGNLTTAEGVE
ncbi:MAG: small basic family protein [Armatimonadetes bacterium]|nr:DUF1290 domain-containing protein [Armatimonadota bacterium]MBS1704083.1 small basic family protein [Armatimonadota bacterium]MBS1725573.1 small basic family protein [Armatimonadota bacterium]